MKDVKILVVIVAYQGDKWLLESLPLLRHPNIVVYLRDNDHNDETLGLAQKLLGSQLVYDGGVNLGFARGNNRGMEYAIEHQFDWVFLLNQDAKIQARKLLGWIQQIHPSEVPIIHCPIQMNWDGNGANYNFQHRYAPGWEDHSRPFRATFINAAAWLISWNTLQSIGGFNPVFFMYGEDKDYVERLVSKGGHIMVYPNVHVFHESTAQKKSTDLPWVAWNKVFKDEVSSYFNERSRVTPPNRGHFWRFLKRMFNRSFGRLVLSGVLFPTEVAVYRHIQAHSQQYMTIKGQLRHQKVPFLATIRRSSD